MSKAIRANAASIVLGIIGTALACTVAACVACVGFLATIQPALAGGLSRTDTPAADRNPTVAGTCRISIEHPHGQAHITENLHLRQGQ